MYIHIHIYIHTYIYIYIDIDIYLYPNHPLVGDAAESRLRRLMMKKNAIFFGDDTFKCGLWSRHALEFAAAEVSRGVKPEPWERRTPIRVRGKRRCQLE